MHRCCKDVLVNDAVDALIRIARGTRPSAAPSGRSRAEREKDVPPLSFRLEKHHLDVPPPCDLHRRLRRCGPDIAHRGHHTQFVPPPGDLRVDVAWRIAYGVPEKERSALMPGIYKLIEVVGTSPSSFAEAVKGAVIEAGKTVQHMDWFEVIEQRGAIKDAKVAEFQVTVRIGFKIDR